jgi:multimeric flavodoxin WrbA
MSGLRKLPYFPVKGQSGAVPGRQFDVSLSSSSPVLDAVDACDGLILGSPVYIGEVTASMRALIERLAFRYISCGADLKPRFTWRIPVTSAAWNFRHPS